MNPDSLVTAVRCKIWKYCQDSRSNINYGLLKYEIRNTKIKIYEKTE